MTQHEKSIGVESDQLPVGKLAVMTLALCMIIAMSVVGMRVLYRHQSEKEIYKQQLNVSHAELEAVRKTEEAAQNSYSQIAGKPGVYRIPVDKAVQKILNTPALLGAAQ